MSDLVSCLKGSMVLIRGPSNGPFSPEIRMAEPFIHAFGFHRLGRIPLRGPRYLEGTLNSDFVISTIAFMIVLGRTITDTLAVQDCVVVFVCSQPQLRVPPGLILMVTSRYDNAALNVVCPLI